MNAKRKREVAKLQYKSHNKQLFVMAFLSKVYLLKVIS